MKGAAILLATIVFATGCPGSDEPAGDGAPPGCTPACGPNATCRADATCACAPGWNDCDGDLGQGGDGCECSGDCNGASCSIVQSCKPETLNACGNSSMYCKADHCAPCRSGSYNCDGVQDCESNQPCLPDGKCELYGSKSCGSQSQYCDSASGSCKPCMSGTYNCDTSGGSCECTTGCDGTSCKSECTFETGCNDNTKYCDLGSCKPCPTGKYNCDGKGSCECSDGCNGTACAGARACDYYDQNVCGGDSSQWCSNNNCIACTSGYFNCNGTQGCECDSQGCNGTQCAGKCSGGECP